MLHLYLRYYLNKNRLCARIRQSARFYWVSVKGEFPVQQVLPGGWIELRPMLTGVLRVPRRLGPARTARTKAGVCQPLCSRPSSGKQACSGYQGGTVPGQRKRDSLRFAHKVSRC
jgi:hypothetical protein